MVSLVDVRAVSNAVLGKVWNENPARSLDYTVWIGEPWQIQPGSKVIAAGHLGPNERSAEWSTGAMFSTAQTVRLTCAARVEGETYSPTFGPIFVEVTGGPGVPVPAYTMDSPWIEAVRDLPLEQKEQIVSIYETLGVTPDQVVLIGGAPYVTTAGGLAALPPQIMPGTFVSPVPGSSSLTLLLIAAVAWAVLR